jgi:hypothetical protein
MDYASIRHLLGSLEFYPLVELPAVSKQVMQMQALEDF